MISSIQSLAGLAAVLPGVFAGFDAASSRNVAVSWGSNDAEGLRSACTNMEVDVITIAAMNANVDVSDLGEQITTCQEDHNTTVLLSLDGSSFPKDGFPSVEEAESAAQRIWGMFGPSESDEERPFGHAVIDGFNLEMGTNTNNMEAFSKKVRSIMDASVVEDDRPFLLSTRSSGPSESSIGRVVALDFVVVQVPAGQAPAGELRRSESSLGNVFDQSQSQNSDAKVLVALSGSDLEELSQTISQASQSSTFGGVVLDNADSSILEKVTQELLAANAAPTATMPAPTARAIIRRSGSWGQGGRWNTTITTLPIPHPTGTGAPSPPQPTGQYEVPAFGQCGGQGYNGPTKCKAPLACVYKNEMWSSCRPERSHRVFDVNRPGHGSPA